MVIIIFEQQKNELLLPKLQGGKMGKRKKKRPKNIFTDIVVALMKSKKLKAERRGEGKKTKQINIVKNTCFLRDFLFFFSPLSLPS